MGNSFLDIYLNNPSEASSLPYWKSLIVTIPNNMRIVKDDEYNKKDYKEYNDTLYFKLTHRLDTIDKPILKDGFRVVKKDIYAFTNHINECYGESVTPNEVYLYTKRKTYDKDMWIVVVNDKNEVVASIIGEVDKKIKEGIIEWVEVSKEYRKQGLGTYLVNELLTRMKDKVNFVTVSGKLNSDSNPIRLYEKCGFINKVIYHVLKTK